MFNISFVEDYEGFAFDEETLVLIVNYIAQQAEKEVGPGKISKTLVVLDSDMDRIFLSGDSEANKDSAPDYIIRTWEYSLNGECISIDWTFHVMGDCEDMEGMCSQDHCDGSDEIPLGDEPVFDIPRFNMDEFIEWSKERPFSLADYNNCNVRTINEMLDYCCTVVSSFPDCAEPCLEMLKAYLDKFWGNQWRLKEYVRQLCKNHDAYEAPEFGALAMKLAEKVSTLPEALLLPLKESYPTQLEIFSDQDSDPFLGGYSLDRCLENQLYPDLDYLWERYGDDGLYKVFSSFSDPEEDVDYYSAETIKRLATVSKTCASEMELCASCAVDGFEKEDHFRAISLLLSFGEEFTDTLSYNDFDDYVCGYGDIDRILYYFDPELLRKYGLEDVVEEIFKALNCEYADYFWEYYIDQFPNFITDILPIVHEHIAKGSADAKNVFTKIEHYHQ